MRLRDEKISHIANLITNKIKGEGLVEFIDEVAARREIKQAITDYLRLEDMVDAKVRGRIASYSRKIPEGSGEWEVLYKKFLAEEMAKARGKRRSGETL
mgnify:CR=1 FL=1